MMDNKTTAALFKNARRFLGLSQREMAAQLNISQPFLCRLEQARRAPSVQSLRRLRELCGLSYSQLLGLSGY